MSIIYLYFRSYNIEAKYIKIQKKVMGGSNRDLLSFLLFFLPDLKNIFLTGLSYNIFVCDRLNRMISWFLHFLKCLCATNMCERYLID